MTVDQEIARAARGLYSTKPPKWLRKLAHPVRPAELGPVKPRQGKKVAG